MRNSEIEEHEKKLAYRVEPFCRSIGIGRTKFYELMASGKIKTVVHWRPTINSGRRSAPPRARGLRMTRRSLNSRQQKKAPARTGAKLKDLSDGRDTRPRLAVQ